MCSICGVVTLVYGVHLCVLWYGVYSWLMYMCVHTFEDMIVSRARQSFSRVFPFSMPFVMSLKQDVKAYTKNKGRAPVPGTEAELAKRTMVTAAVTRSPGPTPFVNKMKWVKWLLVVSELSENSMKTPEQLKAGSEKGAFSPASIWQ